MFVKNKKEGSNRRWDYTEIGTYQKESLYQNIKFEQKLSTFSNEQGWLHGFMEAHGFKTNILFSNSKTGGKKPTDYEQNVFPCFR